MLSCYARLAFPLVDFRNCGQGQNQYLNLRRNHEISYRSQHFVICTGVNRMPHPGNGQQQHHEWQLRWGDGVLPENRLWFMVERFKHKYLFCNFESVLSRWEFPLHAVLLEVLI